MICISHDQCWNNKSSCRSNFTMQAGDRKQGIYNWWPYVRLWDTYCSSCYNLFDQLEHYMNMCQINFNALLYTAELSTQPWVLWLDMGCRLRHKYIYTLQMERSKKQGWWSDLLNSTSNLAKCDVWFSYRQNNFSVIDMQ